ncbi:MAG: M28 family peptidase [Deltaproteobacteria bacterium]|nr:M28 family peptidase [Deltaproteobacteria bacterium]
MIVYSAIIIVFIFLFLLYSVLAVRMSSPVTVSKRNISLSAAGAKLHDHVRYLTIEVGSRSVIEQEKIEKARCYIQSALADMGVSSEIQDYEYGGNRYSNVIVTVPGSRKPAETVIFGAHYDTVTGTPGADDNASAVAVLLEMCRMLKHHPFGRTLKLIFFVLEEPPVFRTDFMGSLVYAKAARARNEDIRAMVCLEMVGYFSDKKGAQRFPFPFMNFIYSSTPDFIAVVGNLRSRRLVHRVASSLREGCRVPVETLSGLSLIPGVDFSDHRSFWIMGYPAVMVTDTAFYRNPAYHTKHDTIDTLDFATMDELLNGLVTAARDLTDTLE